MVILIWKILLQLANFTLTGHLAAKSQHWLMIKDEMFSITLRKRTQSGSIPSMSPVKKSTFLIKLKEVSKSWLLMWQLEMFISFHKVSSFWITNHFIIYFRQQHWIVWFWTQKMHWSLWKSFSWWEFAISQFVSSSKRNDVLDQISWIKNRRRALGGKHGWIGCNIIVIF